MAKKYFQTHEDFISKHIGDKTNPRVAKMFRDYCFNCIPGFLLFVKIARLAEINAPALLLKKEIHKMEFNFSNTGFACNEVAKLKKILFDEYPDIKSKIKGKCKKSL